MYPRTTTGRAGEIAALTIHSASSPALNGTGQRIFLVNIYPYSSEEIRTDEDPREDIRKAAFTDLLYLLPSRNNKTFTTTDRRDANDAVPPPSGFRNRT